MSRGMMMATVAVLAMPAVAGADSGDFLGGFTYAQARDDLDSLPGLSFELRHRRPHLWLAAALSFEPAVDLSNPEQGELRLLVAGGGAAGAHVDLGPRVTLIAGARVEALTATAWPGAFSSNERVFGVRVGPLVAAQVFVGRAYGHPMGLELRGAWAQHAVSGGDDLGLWQVGVMIWGQVSGISDR